MTGLDVPEEFIEVLRKLEGNLKPGRVVDALRWAVLNPEKAKDVARRFHNLGHYGKREFEKCMQLGYNPEYAVEFAEIKQSSISRRRSMLGKILKSDGYRFKMPNGAECTIKHKDGCFEFTFNFCGVEATLIRKGSQYIEITVEKLLEGHVTRYGVKAVLYKGKKFDPDSTQARIIMKAIEENVNPEVLAATDL